MKYIINFSTNSIVEYVDGPIRRTSTIPSYLNTSSVLRLMIGCAIYNYTCKNIYDNIFIASSKFLIKENNNCYSIKEENYNSETGVIIQL